MCSVKVSTCLWPIQASIRNSVIVQGVLAGYIMHWEVLGDASLMHWEVLGDTSLMHWEVLGDTRLMHWEVLAKTS